MKNINHAIKKTAQEEQLPENQVAMLLSGYWQYVEKKMSSLETTTIALRNIGVITISRRKINILIKRRLTAIRGLKKEPDRYEPIKQQRVLNDHYLLLKKALVQRNAIAKEYFEYEQRKKKRKNGSI